MKIKVVPYDIEYSAKSDIALDLDFKKRQKATAHV